MGKAAKWFRALLGFKNPDSTPPPPRSAAKPQKENRRWSFGKSYREKQQNAAKFGGSEIQVSAVSSQESVRAGDAESNKRAVAVAAATASGAAVAVVRLTSRRRSGSVTASCGGGRFGAFEKWWAAVRIQSAFRGYLARKALRALRGLVRLQALVRGHIERKRTAQWLRRMQALLQAQARARAGRSLSVSDFSYSSGKSSQTHYLDPANPEKSEQLIRAKSRKSDQLSTLKRSSHGDHDRAPFQRTRSHRHATDHSHDRQRSSTATATADDDQRSDKILEIDTTVPKIRNQSADQYSHSYAASKDSTTHRTDPIPSSGEFQSSTHLKISREIGDDEFYSASSRGGSSLTPSRSDGSRSFLSGYADHPNYMSYTESSKAKARSLSAPKQRPRFDRSGSSDRNNSVCGYGELRSGSQKISVFNGNFTNKACSGSGRLDRIGMPAGVRC